MAWTYFYLSHNLFRFQFFREGGYAMLSVQETPVKICLEPIAPHILRVSLLPLDASVTGVFADIDLSDRITWREPDVCLCGDGQTAAGDFTARLQLQTLTISRGSKTCRS